MRLSCRSIWNCHDRKYDKEATNWCKIEGTYDDALKNLHRLPVAYWTQFKLSVLPFQTRNGFRFDFPAQPNSWGCYGGKKNQEVIV